MFVFITGNCLFVDIKCYTCVTMSSNGCISSFRKPLMIFSKLIFDVWELLLCLQCRWLLCPSFIHLQWKNSTNTIYYDCTIIYFNIKCFALVYVFFFYFWSWDKKKKLFEFFLAKMKAIGRGGKHCLKGMKKIWGESPKQALYGCIALLRGFPNHNEEKKRKR